jgi:hypothetical protein
MSAILEYLKLRIKQCGVEVIFHGITCLSNFMKIHLPVQKSLVGGDMHTGTHTDDFISLLSLLESRLKRILREKGGEVEWIQLTQYKENLPFSVPL